MLVIGEPAVDWAAVLDVVWASFLAGVGVTAAFALAILGATRAGELRRDGRELWAGAYAGLMMIALAVVGAAVVLGIVVMTQKD
jgi:hypothetical protein